MQDHTAEEYSKDIREDPHIKGLLDRIPEKVRSSFSDEQLNCLKIAMGAQRGGRHPVDIRGRMNFKLWRYYYVLLLGHDRREQLRNEKHMSKGAKFLFWCTFLLFSTALGWLILCFIRFLVHAGFGTDFIADASLIINNLLKIPV